LSDQQIPRILFCVYSACLSNYVNFVPQTQLSETVQTCIMDIEYK
jgi:hypothetical protein